MNLKSPRDTLMFRIHFFKKFASKKSNAVENGKKFIILHFVLVLSNINIGVVTAGSFYKTIIFKTEWIVHRSGYCLSEVRSIYLLSEIQVINKGTNYTNE